MTLIPNAGRQFEMRKMDIDRAFRAAMHALMEIERGSPPNGSLPSVSEEFNVIVTLAQELARNRDNQEVSVDDLLTALDRLPPDSSAAQLIRGERKNGATVPDTERTLAQLSMSLPQHFEQMNQQFQDVRRMVDVLRLDLPGEDVERLKEYLEHRDGALEQLIKNGFSDIVKRLAPTTPEAPGPGSVPEPTSPTGADEDSIWERIFGKKSHNPPPVEPAPVQPRWGV
jgi:hypothetical protein